MSLEKVRQLFGSVPRISDGISDPPGAIKESSARRIKAASRELSIRYPQTNFSVVVSNLPKDPSNVVYAIWIFNESGIAKGLNREWNNFDILLTLDPAFGRASLMVGYGLETFLSEARLAAIVAEGQPDFAAENYGEGIEKVIEATSNALADIFESLEETHGLAPIVTVKASLSQAEVSPSEF